MGYIIVFIAAFFLSSPYVIDICSGYLNHYNFDLQEFLLWHYASINNLILYKDIFYPYGLFNYFKNYNLILASIHYLIVPLLFIFIFFIFKKIFKDKLILYFSFISFYIFILIVVGFQTFARYGLLTIISLFFSYLLYSNKKIKISMLFGCGITLGLFFSLINDQGIYLILSFIFIYFLSLYLQVKKEHFPSTNFYLNTIKEMLYIALGFFIGMVPLFLFLLSNDRFGVFFHYFKDVREIVVVAKTPFFSFIDSPANMFTIVILYFAIFYNFLKLFIFKQKFTFLSLLQISLIFSILIMEYKSIIRSIDRQITFVSLMLLMFLVYEIVNYFKSMIINKRVVYILLILAATVLYGFNVGNQIINFPHLSKSFNYLLNNKCYENNLNYFSANNPLYIEIINLIKRQKKFNGKIFSFPTGDSAFYIFLNQKPPYYNSIFEGASYDSQISTIKYIQDNKIEFIILNTNKSSLQDGVPDYIRQSFLFRYIMNNYYPFAVIGSHMVLKKDKNNDFFASKILGGMKDYKNYLMDVDLRKIPYSEGLYKYSFLNRNSKLVIRTTDIAKINSLLKESTFYSTNKVLVLIPSIDYRKEDIGYVRFNVGNGDNLTIYHALCKIRSKCIINLSNIPIFYRERVITKIILDNKFKGSMEIYDLKERGNLW